MICSWRDGCTAVSLPSWPPTAGKRCKGRWTLNPLFLASTHSRTCEHAIMVHTLYCPVAMEEGINLSKGLADNEAKSTAF